MAKKNGKTKMDSFDQASAVPYRFHSDRLELCLVTSMRNRRWGFPKGVIDAGDTPEQTALKEASEEAGVRGEIRGKPLGRYQYFKWGRMLDVVVYLMEVQEVADSWDESDLRDRVWLGPDEAIQRLGWDRLRPFVNQSLKRLEKGRISTESMQK